MSTNKTENYQLHAWTAEDEERLEEVNENFAKVDGELKERLLVESGGYVGKNEDYAEWEVYPLGFTPTAIIVAKTDNDEGQFIANNICEIAVPDMPAQCVKIVEGGFAVQQRLNWVGRQYRYVCWH